MGSAKSKGVLAAAKRHLFKLRMMPWQLKIARQKRGQLDTFRQLRMRFPGVWAELSSGDQDRFTTSLWKGFSADVERALLPFPPFSFLRTPLIRDTMFVTAGGSWLREEMRYLEERIPRDELLRLLAEDYVGKPELAVPDYLTSHNTVHHLYHLTRFSERTGHSPASFASVVEWGGGYGNLAKLFTRMSQRGITYTLIDLPPFTALQWLYLSTTLGAERVNLMKKAEDEVQPMKVNLLPVHLVEHMSLKGDLFVSTWGLSESSKYSQDLVASRKWFGAGHLLIAYQDSNDALPDAVRVARLAEEAGAVGEDISFLPGNHYLFR